MPMPSVSHPITTVEALLALPDDGLRHELLDGEHVVTPAPALVHQRAVGLLFVPLPHYLSDRRDVELFTSPADVVLGPKILDRKSTRLNSSHGYISYAVFCLKKKKKESE